MRERFHVAVAAWGLTDPRPIGGGAVALVYAAGQTVLKVQPRGHRDERQLAGEGEALAVWEPSGVVPRLLGTRDEGLTLLMERLTPGTTLDEVVPSWMDRLQALGELAARLHSQARLPDRCVSMPEVVAYWRAALADEPELLHELDELVAPGPDDVLLHFDLHGGNALLHGADWKVIDPKAVRGDRHADVWALLEPDAPALPQDLVAARRAARERVECYAEAANLDADRAAAWIRLRAHAEAASVNDVAWTGRLRALAAALSP